MSDGTVRVSLEGFSAEDLNVEVGVCSAGDMHLILDFEDGRAIDIAVAPRVLATALAEGFGVDDDLPTSTTISDLLN